MKKHSISVPVLKAEKTIEEGLKLIKELRAMIEQMDATLTTNTKQKEQILSYMKV